jgi:hypothetical protein
MVVWSSIEIIYGAGGGGKIEAGAREVRRQ